MVDNNDDDFVNIDVLRVLKIIYSKLNDPVEISDNKPVRSKDQFYVYRSPWGNISMSKFLEIIRDMNIDEMKYFLGGLKIKHDKAT
jgi:hypothetical protein